jgi:hypothetical protein
MSGNATNRELKRLYSRASPKLSTRVTREGKLYEVITYATNGPLELVNIHLAISGVESGIEWDQIAEQPECPRWDERGQSP